MKFEVKIEEMLERLPRDSADGTLAYGGENCVEKLVEQCC
jgi:hypothetical protein